MWKVPSSHVRLWEGCSLGSKEGKGLILTLEISPRDTWDGAGQNPWHPHFVPEVGPRPKGKPVEAAPRTTYVYSQLRLVIHTPESCISFSLEGGFRD